MKLNLCIIASLALIENGTAFAPMRTSSRTSTSRLWAGKNEPLASEGDWSAFLDQDNTGMVYYFNTKTGESKWDPPTDSFPSFTMDAETKELARQKRLAYIEANSKEEPKKRGFLSSILASNEEEKEETVVEEKQESVAWYQGLFDIKEGQAEEETKPAEKEEKETSKDESGGFLSNLLGKRGSNGAVKADSQPLGVADKVLGGSKALESVKKEKPAKKKKDTPVTVTSEDEDGGFLSSLLGKRGNNGVVTADSKPLNVADKVFTTGGNKPLKLDTSSFVLPHPAKVSWGGEDAVFVKGRSFGVFDGVSGAEKLDGIPLFSTTLADEMKRMLNEEGATTKEMISCLADAADFANRAATGASTALVASIGEDDFLRVLNLGDCACWVIRNGEVVARSKEIVHYFDCPYQLSEDSPDRSQDGTKLNFEVIPGDVIVMGSDGVFDNLSQETICETIASSPPKAKAMAKRIADKSRKVSLDEDALTPYATLAKRNGFQDFASGRGGKVDDISCVVVRVT
jgi:protein phosphatase PTC7